MSLYKNFHMFSKIDDDINGYVDNLEKHVGKIERCVYFPDFLSRGSEVGREGISETYKDNSSMSDEACSCLMVYTLNCSFELRFQSPGNNGKDDKYSIVELTDSGDCKFSYEELFKPYMEFAKEYGNTYYYGNSELGFFNDLHGKIEALCEKPHEKPLMPPDDMDGIVRFKQDVIGLEITSDEKLLAALAKVEKQRAAEEAKSVGAVVEPVLRDVFKDRGR